MAVLAWCDLAVSNDSGLLHIAAATGRPVVALFGSTNPDRTGPTGPRVRIVRRSVSCSPCELRSCPIDHRCMTWIDVEEVHAAVVALLVAPAERATRGPAAVFLDRDGTLNRDVGYLSDPDQLELLPGVEPAVRALNDAGFRVVVVTNQSGVARGLITAPQLDAIHRRLTERLRAAGAVIDEILCCPHHPEARCGCRKPEPALVAEAQARLGIDLARSFVVGDKLADVRLARRVGAKSVLVRTGHGQQTLERWPEGEPPPDHVADDLPNAVRWILQTAAVPA
jgi:heptosyltransferase-2